MPHGSPNRKIVIAYTDFEEKHNEGAVIIFDCFNQIATKGQFCGQTVNLFEKQTQRDPKGPAD